MSYNVALLLSMFLGSFGADRLYIGKIGTGIVKALTAGGLGIWTIIDVFLTFYNKQTDVNGNALVGQENRNKAILVGLSITPLAGLLGFHRFYLNQTGIGIAKIGLLFAGLISLAISHIMSFFVFVSAIVWYAVDAYLVLKGEMKDAKDREIVHDKERYQTTAVLISIYWGFFGVDRYYLGHKSLAIIKAVTYGGFGIWYLLDILLVILNNLKDSKGQKMKQH